MAEEEEQQHAPTPSVPRLQTLAARKLTCLLLANDALSAETGAGSGTDSSGGTAFDDHVGIQPMSVIETMLTTVVRSGSLTPARLQSFLAAPLLTLDISDIPWVRPYDSLLAALPSTCPSIETLILDGAEASETSLTSCLTGLTNLTHLSLNSCGNTSDDTLQAAFASCGGQLTYLAAQFCGELEDPFDGFVLPNLSHVDLSFCGYLEVVSGLNTTGSLTHLALRGCRSLETVDIPNVTGLKALNLKGASRVESSILERLGSQAMPTLEKLVLSECRVTGAMLRRWASTGIAPSLSSTSGTAEHATTTAAPLPLTKLDLSWVDDLDDLEDTAALEALLARCPSMRRLGLRKLSVPESTARVISKLPVLQVLLLGRTGGVTDAGVQLIVNTCPKLRRLDLSWCDLLTEAALVSVLDSCPDLEVLSMEGCKSLTEAVVDIVKAAKHVKALRFLDLSWVNLAGGTEIVEQLIQILPHPDIRVVDYYTDGYSKETAGSVFKMLEEADDGGVLVSGSAIVGTEDGVEETKDSDGV